MNIPFTSIPLFVALSRMMKIKRKKNIIFRSFWIFLFFIASFLQFLRDGDLHNRWLRNGSVWNLFWDKSNDLVFPLGFPSLNAALFFKGHFLDAGIPTAAVLFRNLIHFVGCSFINSYLCGFKDMQVPWGESFQERKNVNYPISFFFF